jgi:hypothetical protein
VLQIIYAKSIKALILTADKSEDMELFFPYLRLLEERIEVDRATPKKGHIEGEHGYRLEKLRKLSRPFY